MLPASSPDTVRLCSYRTRRKFVEIILKVSRKMRIDATSHVRASGVSVGALNFSSNKELDIVARSLDTDYSSLCMGFDWLREVEITSVFYRQFHLHWLPLDREAFRLC